MSVILAMLSFYGLIILFMLAVIKGYFTYGKAKVLWLGKQRTLYYYVRERVSPGGLKYDCYLADFHLLYFTYGDHVWLSVENGKISWVHAYLSGRNTFAKKSWIRDMIIKLPRKMGISEAMESLKDKMSKLTDAQFSAAADDLMCPENRAFQKILDQLPVSRDPTDASEIIRNLPGK